MVREPALYTGGSSHGKFLFLFLFGTCTSVPRELLGCSNLPAGPELLLRNSSGGHLNVEGELMLLSLCQPGQL